MSKKDDHDLLEMVADLRASGGGRGRRSPLFRWLFKRASAFEQMLEETQPSWESVAAALAKRDLKDGAGKHPTAERARKTWFEVRRVKGWHGKPVPAPQPPIRAIPPPSPVIAVPQPAPTADLHPLADARSRLLARMKPVTIPKKEHT